MPSTRYSATFTFAPGAYDDAFHALDTVIAEVARRIPGYLGEESWENAATGLICNVYYWDSLTALEALMQHPAHVAAKQQQARWLRGYHVVIAQVIQAHGDGGIAHPLLALARAPAQG
ncbi:MAG: antibiotic biosynthesis monooxygenase [Comamonadaceae bacterium]|nr:MAG: antibiotic biosynthesis monooxygenase [Comamonadaceae bacterium]